MRLGKCLLWLLASVVACHSAAAPAESVSTAETPDRTAVLLSVEGAIGPATEDYLVRAFNQAAELAAAIIILRLDTPGGLDTAMRAVIRRITASPVPVVTYVAPAGARAASAGTYILYASHIAAMAPGTNLGAATPVSIGVPAPGGPPEEAGNKDQAKREGGSETAAEKKAINDAAAYIRGLAELRGRNADWAERAVREAASLQASEALSQNVIDILAEDVDDLLAQIEGRVVSVQGNQIALHTRGLPVTELLPDWRSRLLGVLTNPNVAYILMLVGIYGLLLEFYSPGSLVPGTVGAICLLLALYAFLPVNYAGVGLILLGVGFMIAEAFQPSFGMLGIGGVIAFVIGSIILMDTEILSFRLYLPVVITAAILSALLLVAMVSMALSARRRPVVSGKEELLGALAQVTEDFAAGQVRVFLHSESWRGHCAQPLHKGQWARVTAVNGLTLELEPVESAPSEDGT